MGGESGARRGREAGKRERRERRAKQMGRDNSGRLEKVASVMSMQVVTMNLVWLARPSYLKTPWR